MRRSIQCLLWSLVAVNVAGIAAGATITVRKDGSGDFSVIQQALDVAADGDTVQIGPGEYAESTMVRLPGWAYDIGSFANIESANVTLIGAGMDATVIGPSSYRGNGGTFEPAAVSYGLGGGYLQMSGLTVRNCYAGMYVGGELRMDNCALIDNDLGVGWDPSGPGGWIRDSVFIVDAPISFPLAFDIGGGGQGSGIELERCTFGSPASIRTIQGMVIRDCLLSGLNVYSATTLVVDGCNPNGLEAGISMALGAGIYCEVRNSHLRGQTAALFVSDSAPGGRFVVENSTLEGGSYSVFFAAYNAGASAVHNCDLIKGTGLVVRCGAQGPPIVHDFSNNYWGTTDEAQIQSWIFDHSDNGVIGGTVLYSPFAGQSVPIETTTWGDLKALWR